MDYVLKVVNVNNKYMAVRITKKEKGTEKKTGSLLSKVGTEANASSSNKKFGKREVIKLSSGTNVVAKRVTKKGAAEPVYKIGRKTYADKTGEFTTDKGKLDIGRNKKTKNTSSNANQKTIGQKIVSALPKVGGPKSVYLKGSRGFKGTGAISRGLKKSF